MGQEGVLNNAAVLRLLSSGGGGGMVGEPHPGLQSEFQDRPVSIKKKKKVGQVALKPKYQGTELEN